MSERKEASAADIIRALDLQPHPEGGYYRQTFCDAPGADGRPSSTAIYFLLARDQVSRWHRVDAAEVWHFYRGAPLELKVSDTAGPVQTIRLGPDLQGGEAPQYCVPAGVWQGARTLGEWTLVGCTVAPGFRFSGFELAAPGWEPSAGAKSL